MVLPTCVVPERERSTSCIGTSAHVGRVVNDGMRIRQAIFGIGAAVVFATAIAFSLLLDGAPKLPVPSPSFIIIERVVSTKSGNHVFDGCRSTKEFHSVIRIGNDFNEFEVGACSHSAQGQAIDFVARTDICASVTDGHVRDGSTAVFVIFSSVSSARFGIRNAFDLCFAGRRVQLGIAQQNHPPPLAAHIEWRRSVERVGFKRENDGSFCCSIGLDLPPSSHHQCRGISPRTGLAFDDRSGFNGEHVACIHKNKTIQDVGVVVCPCGCACARTIIGYDNLSRSRKIRKKEKEKNRNARDEMIHFDF